MKLALLGYGKMGKTIERIALERGHDIVARIDENNRNEMESDAFLSCDVVIEFTNPSSALTNYMTCLQHHLPIVSGTTGWLAHFMEVEAEVKRTHGAFFYASNFSVGVYVFDQISRKLAAIMNHCDRYDVSMDETHHVHKKDHPSGTALTLAEGIVGELSRKSVISAELFGDTSDTPASDALLITCHREGEVPGTHTIKYDSPEDSIVITHEAKGREGFALGAVLAAEFLKGKTGVFGMKDLMAF